VKRHARVLVAIVAVQSLLMGLYWLVERDREAIPRAQTPLGIGPPRRVDIAWPRLSLRTRNGKVVELAPSSRPTLIHFWATWCPPCGAELPGLLALPRKFPVNVVTVALDEEAADVDRFLGPHPEATVLLGDPREVESMLGVTTLPVTFLSRVEGRLALRFDGARDWTDEAFCEAFLRAPFE